eukprot:2726827-Alexandrium_andersonii.AAC.1
MLRPFLGRRSSSSERLTQFCTFGSSSSERVLFGVNASRSAVGGFTPCTYAKPVRWRGQDHLVSKLVMRFAIRLKPPRPFKA